VPNNPPNANAGTDFNVTEGQSASLNGTASSDPDGDALSFAWVEVGTSFVTLQNANTATPSFTAPMVGASLNLTFQLTVNDGRGGVDTDTIVVTVQDSAVNNPPTANAGPDAFAVHNDTVQLDGSGSTDPDGDSLTFAWTQIGGANVVSLSSTSSSIPTFTAPATDDTLVFELLVNDGRGGTNTDTVTITVNASGGPPSGGGPGGGSGGGGGKGGGGGCSTDHSAGWWLAGLLAALGGALCARRRRET
jgi:hypothetical protein